MTNDFAIPTLFMVSIVCSLCLVNYFSSRRLQKEILHLFEYIIRVTEVKEEQIAELRRMLEGAKEDIEYLNRTLESSDKSVGTDPDTEYNKVSLSIHIHSSNGSCFGTIFEVGERNEVVDYDIVILANEMYDTVSEFLTSPVLNEYKTFTTEEITKVVSNLLEPTLEKGTISGEDFRIDFDDDSFIEIKAI